MWVVNHFPRKLEGFASLFSIQVADVKLIYRLGGSENQGHVFSAMCEVWGGPDVRPGERKRRARPPRRDTVAPKYASHKGTARRLLIHRDGRPYTRLALSRLAQIGTASKNM